MRTVFVVCSLRVLELLCLIHQGFVWFQEEVWRIVCLRISDCPSRSLWTHQASSWTGWPLWRLWRHQLGFSCSVCSMAIPSSSSSHTNGHHEDGGLQERDSQHVQGKCWWCICVPILFELASGQVLRRSQGTLLPSSVNPRYRIRGTNVWFKNLSIKDENT
jgi:hypothetical protein